MVVVVVHCIFSKLYRLSSEHLYYMRAVIIII